MNPDLQQLLVDDLNLAPETLHPDSRLDDAGLDSLGIVELSVTLSEKWGVEIGENELAAAATLAGLDRLVDERRSGR